MPAIRCSSDGLAVFVAAEDVVTGFPVVFQMDAATHLFSSAYEPGAGSAVNVQSVAANPDKMLFYGNFGTDVVVVSYEISTGLATDISPAGRGAAVVNCASVNSSNEDEINITVNTEQTFRDTSNGGASWITRDAAMGFDATALLVLWSSDYELYRYFACGENGGGDLEVQYSPNEGRDTEQLAESTLEAAAAICNIEAING